MAMARSYLQYLRRTGVTVVAAAALAYPAQAGLAGVQHSAVPHAVRAAPASGTPSFPAVTKDPEQIRKLVQCRATMYAVGKFYYVDQNGRRYIRHNAFSFRARAPFTITSWSPDINGEVNSIAFNNGNCRDAYLGGDFTRIGSAAAHNIAEVSTVGTGRLVRAFKHDASARVETLASYQDHVLVGGFFGKINGSRNRYLASLNAKTGKDDGLLRLRISGSYRYPGVVANSTRVYNQQVSHSGRLDLVEGDFTSAGGRRRLQMFMVNLASRPHATVTGWTSPEFDGSKGNINVKGGYPYQCFDTEPFYIRSAAWSPDDSTIYTASTGFHPWNVPHLPLRGLCDAAAAFPARHRSVLHKWVNYDGCYSLYSAAADRATAYFAGHELWSQSPDGCKQALDPHRIYAPGMEGLSPSSGRLIFNPTRSRGIGADYMLVTAAGLWIASDNLDGAQSCAHVGGHAGLCFLPYK
jgi:hypothetical protein